MSSKQGKKGKKKSTEKRDEADNGAEVLFDPMPTATDEEKALVPQLRKKVEDKLTESKLHSDFERVDVNFPLNDHTYLRFLRARKLDLEAAADMLIACIDWRLKNKPHLVDEHTTALFSSVVSALIYGRDKQGRPIFWMIPRNDPPMDYKKEGEKTLRFIVYTIEQLLVSLNKDGKRLCILMDLKGFSLFHNDEYGTKFMIDVLANYYPETLGECWVVDAPWIFHPIWYVAKNWMDPVTAAKVKLISKSDLSQYLNLDEFPRDLHGNKDENYVYVPKTEGMTIPKTIDEVVLQDEIPWFLEKFGVKKPKKEK